MKDLTVILGYSCNLGCSFCNQKDEDKVLTDPDKLLSKLRDLLEKNPTIKSVSIKGGEPFLYPELLSKVVGIVFSFCSKITILTNGTQITQPYVNWLNDNNLIITLSIDSIISGQKPVFMPNILPIKNIKNLNINYVLESCVLPSWVDTIHTALEVLKPNNLSLSFDTNELNPLTQESVSVLYRYLSNTPFKDKLNVTGFFSKDCVCAESAILYPNGSVKNSHDCYQGINKTPESNKGCLFMRDTIPGYNAFVGMLEAI